MSHEESKNLTRRAALVAGGLGAAGLATLKGRRDAGKSSSASQSASQPGSAPATEARQARSPAPADRMPVVFVPHGGGPWPFVELGFDKDEMAALAGYLGGLARLPRQPPKALLVISAHWEEPVPTVMTAARPPMLYDYYGFPPESYQITWPAPGDPATAARVRQLLRSAGFDSAEDPARGYDHGTFVPLKLAYPEARVPTVQLSLRQGLDPRAHLAIGRALAPLRDEGVYIIGSGMTFHNLRAFGDPRARAASEEFDEWLRATAALPQAQRDQRLTEWAAAPAARFVHPREEHLLPLMVIAGAAGADPGTVGYQGVMMGVQLSSYHFG